MDKTINTNKTYTRREAAELLGVDIRTIWLYIQKGILPAIIYANKYRIKGGDLKKLTEEGTQKHGRKPNREKMLETASVHIDPEKVYTLEETANMLFVKPATVKTYVKSGKLRADIQGKRRLYYFKGEDITKFYFYEKPRAGRPAENN